MRWKGRERSTNVEDRRRATGMKLAGGGGIIAVIIVVISLLAGRDPRPLLNQLDQAQQPGQVAEDTPGEDDPTLEFVEVVLRDTEKVWEKLFREQVSGSPTYRPPRLTLFKGSSQTGCGLASAAMGPFYCPADQHVYLDPDFFVELKQRFNAPGDFAHAYVIAHEVAHHVQESLGLMRELNRARQSGDERQVNRQSVRVELQADYLAGVWAHHAQRDFQILEEGDIEEAINAANQIGDDRLQKMSTGYVVPERYTHGTSAQRVRWFMKGLKSGDFKGCEQLFQIDYDDL